MAPISPFNFPRRGVKMTCYIKNLARLAASVRAARRNQIAARLPDGLDVEIVDIRLAEEQYEDNRLFIENGIIIEPFNLVREREEGYFDAAGFYIEYKNAQDARRSRSKKQKLAPLTPARRI